MHVKPYRLSTGAGFVVRDAEDRAPVYVYGNEQRTTAQMDKLTMDEAEQVAKLVAAALRERERDVTQP